MPLLPIPLGGTRLTGGDLPVTDAADVLSEFPAVHKAPATAPVRDAFCEAFAAGFTEYQDSIARAFGQFDPTRANGKYLDAIAAEKEIYRLPDESDTDFRARLFEIALVVTPDAIVALINELLAPYTTKHAQVLELELDGWFVHDGTATAWDSFIGSQPRYPDRLYEADAAENAGFFLTYNNPGYCIPSAGLPRNFHVRAPVLSNVGDTFTFILDTADGTNFIGDGTNAFGHEADGLVATSIFDNLLSETDIYQMIVDQVQVIKGQGVSWSLYVDGTL